MADKCIGNLTLNIDGVKKSVDEVNKLLEAIGVGKKVNISSKVTAAVREAMKDIMTVLEQGEKRIAETAEKASKAIEKIGKSRENEASIQKTIALYEKLYNARNKVEELRAKGETEGVAYAKATADVIKYEQALSKVADATKKEAQARKEYENIINKSVSVRNAARAEEEAREIQKATDAYIRMQKARAEVSALEAKGMQDTEQYARAVMVAGQATDAWLEYSKAVRDAAKASEEARHAVQDLNNVKNTTQNAADAKEIEKATQAYIRLLEARSKLNQLEAQGRQNTEEYARAAKASGEAYDAFLKYSKGARDAARASTEARRAIQDLNNVRDAAHNAAEAKEIEKATQAYIKMLEARSKLKQLEAQGRQNTEEYAKIAKASGEAYDAFMRYSKGARDAAKASIEARHAMADLENIERAVAQGASSKTVIDDTENAYKRLTFAIREYTVAKRAWNDEQASYWQSQIDGAMGVLNAVEQMLPSLNLEEKERERILDLINAARTQQDGMQKNVLGTSHATGELEMQVKSLITRYFSLIAVIRMISNLTKNMVEYVSQYSDKMNEIQMITLKTDEEVERLAETYRGIAAEMNVSSLDMAEAAVYFTRQGLQAEEIEKRLRNVTMYAKAANVEFRDASEIITAVVNSMNLVEQEAEDGRNATQRVADVFLAIGDNAATSGQEIGEAMQKAAASAGAFGVSMEWLAAYIATVSETTRQEARTIGTAFNTIIARLHQIKATGYNQEDETRINDIAKALAHIDVALMDQNGNWRNMETILEEIASKWSTLDGKTRSYIATTMAGVKQQNVFLALMNDMSRQIEGESRAYELYEIAINSAGAAQEKYGVYLDSVAASQERLNIAQEQFYALLDQDVIIGWNNAMASVVGFITDATSAMSGLNIILPLVAGGIALLAVGIQHLAAQITIAGSASQWFATVWESHPVLLVITAVIGAIVTLTTVSGLLSKTAGEMAEVFEKTGKAVDESREKLKKFRDTQKESSNLFADLESGTKDTADILKEYNKELQSIAELSPIAKRVVEQLKAGFIEQKEAAELLNNEIERLIANEDKLALTNLIQRFATYQQGNATNEDIAELLTFAGGGLAQFMGQGDFETAFGKAITNAYMNRTLNDDLMEYIKNTLEAYTGAGFSSDKAWDMIRQDIIYQLFGDFHIPDDYMSTLADQINDEIDYVMATVGGSLDPVEYAVFRKKLFDAIFGEDGELSIQEYSGFSNTIAEFLYNYAMGGIDSIKSELSGLDMAEIIFEILFPDDDGHFMAQLYILGEDAASKFVSGYSDLIKSGFTDDEIADWMNYTDYRQWEDIAGRISSGLKEIIHNAFAFGEDDTVLSEFLDGILNNADLSQLKEFGDIVDTMLDFGVKPEELRGVIEAAETYDEIIKGLQDLKKEKGIVDEVVDTQPIEDFTKQVNEAVNEVKALGEAIGDIEKNGDNYDISKIWDIAKTHPELIMLIGDTNALLERLRAIRDEAESEQRGLFKSFILGSTEAMEGSRYAGSGFTTLGEYRSSLTNVDDIEAFDAEMDQIVARWIELGEQAEETADTTKDSWGDIIDSMKDVQSTISDIDKYIETIRNEGKLSVDDLLDIASSHPEFVRFFGDMDTLMEKLRELRRETADSAKETLKEFMLTDSDFFRNSPFFTEGFENMQAYIDSLEVGSDALAEVTAYVDEASANLVDSAEQLETATKSWLQAQVDAAQAASELEWARSNRFTEQLSFLASEEDGVPEGAEGFMEFATNAIERWNSLDDKMKESISETFPGVTRALRDIEKAFEDAEAGDGDYGERLIEAGERFMREIDLAQKYAMSKTFSGTYKAIQDLTKGTISATDAYETFNGELEKVKSAGNEITAVQAKIAEGTDLQESDVTNLASVLGITTEDVLSDVDGAISAFDEMIGETGILRQAFDDLNRAAFIRITGVSEADFSNIENGLLAVGDMAESTIRLLQATGQWEVEEIPLDGFMSVFRNGKIVREELKGMQRVLKATRSNPYAGYSRGVKTPSSASSKSSGGGGGGGGGGSERDVNQMTEVERMLDRMSQINAIQEYQQSFYQAQSKYHSQAGLLQGVIGYSQKEIDVLKEQNAVLEGNLGNIEKYIDLKRSELAAMSTSDERYEEVADDLDKLQKAHQSYTKQLIDNKSAIDQLNKAIKEQQDKIRKMEIDLRNTILKAIEDREARVKKMLNAEIEMENTILDLIKRRYEKERDQIIETTNMKIDALREERDLLSEQLQLRKEQAEEEDKAAQLANLEAQYQRIIADPTRRKEALEIQKKITDLREDMAWDAAEKEVKAQQDSIDQQITSLEDYIEYIENYYEDLFEHPQKLIEEMRGIMQMTDEEIIEWLKNNSDEFAQSTANTQKTMVDGWRTTLDDMRDIIRDHWEEIEWIISQGEEFIIQFLMDNSEDYRTAGKLQAEAYVDEWRKQLEDLRLAHQQVALEAVAMYSVIEKAESASKNSSGGGSSGYGGGTTSSELRSQLEKTLLSVADISARTGANLMGPLDTNKRYAVNGNTVTDTASGRVTQITPIGSHASSSSSSLLNRSIDNLLLASQPSIKKYATGGMAQETGYAWLDEAERVLNPYQTELFETMVHALESIDRISVPGMSNMNGVQTGGNQVSVGDIIVNVENLDSDEDYEEMAERVCEILMERIGRTTAIGGLRIRSV